MTIQDERPRITTKGRARLLADYVIADASMTGCALHEAAWSVKEAHKVDDADWLDLVLPHLNPTEGWCANCDEHKLALDGRCHDCGCRVKGGG